MRTLRLARVAAEAEVLRLRRRARRAAVHATLAAVAVVFGVAALCFVHVAAFVALETRLAPTSSALVVLGGDLLIALILLFISRDSKPDRIEIEALEVRERAVQQLEEIFITATLAAPMARLLGGPRIVGVAVALLLPRFVAYLRRGGVPDARPDASDWRARGSPGRRI